MPLIHRCDQCGQEIIPPPEGGFAPGWLCTLRAPEGINLLFCSEEHITEFYASRRKPHYPMEKRGPG